MVIGIVVVAVVTLERYAHSGLDRHNRADLIILYKRIHCLVCFLLYGLQRIVKGPLNDFMALYSDCFYWFDFAQTPMAYAHYRGASTAAFGKDHASLGAGDNSLLEEQDADVPDEPTTVAEPPISLPVSPSSCLLLSALLPSPLPTPPLLVFLLPFVEPSAMEYVEARTTNITKANENNLVQGKLFDVVLDALHLAEAQNKHLVRALKSRSLEVIAAQMIGLLPTDYLHQY